MSDENDRVEEALAAHLAHLELGGPEPDVSHLDAEERERLAELVNLLGQTEGVALGADPGDRAQPTASTEAGERLVAAVREALTPPARMTNDPAAAIGIEGMDVVEGWVVGTFGGRVRVWLLADEGALAGSDRWLRDLHRAFRLFPDTAALALVEPDLQCLLVQPEDCAPTIEVPHGSLVGRRYRRPIHPVGEALSVFLRELIPYWEPMHGISEHAGSAVVDVAGVAEEQAERAIQDQVAAGNRARKTNPKRKALTELGSPEAEALSALAAEIHDGRAAPDDLEQRLRDMAKR